MAKLNPGQFRLTSLFVLIGCSAIVAALMRQSLPLATFGMWLLASTWSLARTRRVMKNNASWKSLAWPYWFLVAGFLVMGVILYQALRW